MFWEAFSVVVFPGLLAAVFIGFLYEGIMRKVTARMQHRRGPPIWQPFLDWIKTMTKENITPKAGSGFLMTLCPIVAFASAVMAVMFVPIAGFPSIGFEGNTFVFLYFLFQSVVFFAISGFATGNPYGIVGSIREIMQIISYELPFVISVITIGLFSSFTVKPFIVFTFPFAFIGFILGVMGKLGIAPFHIPEAEQEIIEGALTEYTGARLGMFQLAKAALLWVSVSAAAVMLLGGGNLIIFLIKSLIILFILTFLSNIFARMRIDHAFRFYWFALVPLVLIDLVRAFLGIW
ncbi:MAG: NADH-quinone oxidoreductase subunit H [Candidatus Micrarchaeota archaeon]|nr:NADH-quinone oxidoreductase subunit H [Candidatus Micrarchaeota archaeon]